MDDQTTIESFSNWLQENPANILANAWQNLPTLNEKLSQLNDNQITELADLIIDWCNDNNLGKQLKDACTRYERGTPKPRDPNHPEGVKNTLTSLAEEIMNRYNEEKNKSQTQS